MELISMGAVLVGIILIVFVLLVLVERKWSSPKGSDWYDTPADDELTPLLGVVLPKEQTKKKKKGDE